MVDDLERIRQRRRQRVTPPAGTFGLTGPKAVRANRVLARVEAAEERRDPAAYYAGKTPTPERITMALDFRELYGPEVDQALGGEEPMVDEWEAGDLIPTLEQIRLLAKLTDFPVKFFYLPPPPPLGEGWICGANGCHPLQAREGDEP